MAQNRSKLVSRFVTAILTLALIFIIIWISGPYLPVLIGLLPVLAVAGILLFLFVANVFDSIHERHYLRLERAGLCMRCRYDLRGGHIACPECGMLILHRRNPLTRKVIAAEGSKG
jgi:DNA-directed RNA polymerase subunit RPC12/RpoP